MDKYFKVQIGFGKSDFISIDEVELDKAIYAMVSGKIAIFKNGSVAGNNIISILPDYHKAMGWNYGYEFFPEDWNRINAKCKSYQGVIEEAKNRVNYLIQSGQTHLIGQPKSEKLKEISD